MTDEADIRQILTTTNTIALVGASNNPARPSNGVMAFLLSKGFDVIPVNPGLAGQQIHGRTVLPNLKAIGRPIDMVDIFRAPEHVGPIVDNSIEIRAKTVWMQLGVINQEAAARARAAGLKVVMNRCPKIEWGRLGL